MFAHDARQTRATDFDLSRWIGPLSPAFAAIAAENEGSEGGVGALAQDVRLKPDATKATPEATKATPDATKATPDATKGKPDATSDGADAPAAPDTTNWLAVTKTATSGGGIDLAEVRTLFHTLNNQLGVILTYAELLEAKAADDPQRKRAAQVVAATLEALGTTKALRTEIVKG